MKSNEHGFIILLVACFILLAIVGRLLSYDINWHESAFQNNSETFFKTNKIVVNTTVNPCCSAMKLKKCQNNNANNVTEDKTDHAMNDSSVKIGILIPSSTRSISNPTLENLALVTICLPSIYKTIESKYRYNIYVGMDKGDYLESVKDRLETFDKVKAVISSGRTFTKSVNSIARKAYQDGMDYLVRINDDSSFGTKEWTSKGISVLQTYIPTNIGVVGPTCHEGNTGILTHDMVHRTHIEIFDFYYPPYFDNWWADDWITEVYKPNRTTKLSTWVMKHHLNSHGTRYRVDYKHKARLEKILMFDNNRLIDYLTNNKHV